jgi:hypothetical protein
MNHPSEVDLALYAGGELRAWSRWRVGYHVARCPQCLREVEAFRGGAEWVRETASELPSDLHWSRLAAEMKANIRVGLAAGACVGPVEPRPQRLALRVMAALASIVLVVVSGWWLHLPEPRVAPSVQAGGVVLEATPEGIELKEEDRALTLLHPASDAVVLSVSAQGSLRARYVDAETGQVTINNVYVQ